MDIAYSTNTILELILPPSINFILLLLSLVLLKKYRLLSLILAFLSITSLFLLSLNPVASYLVTSLETEKALTQEQIKQLQNSPPTSRAIVVLGAGRLHKAPEYGEIDTLNAQSLERVNYAAWLQKKLDAPVLLSGGTPNNEATPEAVLMNQVMMSRFNIAPKWIESNSSNLLQSAQFSAIMLKHAQIDEVILVTHAWQTAIAKQQFINNELKVISAPISFYLSNTQSPQNNFPSAKALGQSSDAIQARLKNWWLSL